MSQAVYTIKMPDGVAALIRSLHPSLKKKIRTGMDMIVQTPLIGKPLKQDLQGLYSYRIGKFRIVYRLHGKVIELVAIGPRKHIYSETYRLLRSENH